MADTRLVQGQVANAGRTVQGQYTGPGPEGQGKDPNPDVALTGGGQGQPVDDDVEGQSNDSLPYASDRPYAFPNPPNVDERKSNDPLPRSGSRRR